MYDELQHHTASHGKTQLADKAVDSGFDVQLLIFCRRWWFSTSSEADC